MKTKTELIIVEAVLLAIAIFLFYIAYTLPGIINKIGFTVIGLWILYTIVISYIRKYVKDRVKRCTTMKG